VPVARLVVTQQTISDGTRALDGGCNLLETGRGEPETSVLVGVKKRSYKTTQGVGVYIM